MKEFKKMKKFGAAVTVAAMLGSLSVGVFADEVDPETVEVPEVPAVEESVLPEVPVVEEEPAAAPEEEVSEEAPVVEEEPEADSEEEAPAEEEPAKEDEIVTLAGEDEGELVSGADPAHAIQITGATATLDTEKNLYTVTLNYAFNGVTVGENSQITMLGYIFSSEQVDSEDPTNPSKVTVVEGKIRAIVQQTTKATGSIKFGLAKKTETSAETDLVVEGTEKMVVKLGTDVEGVTKAQAFFIDLANASEGGAGEDVVYGDFNDDGKVTVKDVFILQRHVAKWPDYATIDNVEGADLNTDSKVTVKDVFILQRHVAKWPGYETLPKVD